MGLGWAAVFDTALADRGSYSSEDAPLVMGITANRDNHPHSSPAGTTAGALLLTGLGSSGGPVSCGHLASSPRPEQLRDCAGPRLRHLRRGAARPRV